MLVHKFVLLSLIAGSSASLRHVLHLETKTFQTTSVTERDTNAYRFSHGLPPVMQNGGMKKEMKRKMPYVGQALRPRASALPGGNTAKGTQGCGTMSVNNAETSEFLGFISSVVTSNSALIPILDTDDSPLDVCFAAADGNTDSGIVNLFMQNVDNPSLPPRSVVLFNGILGSTGAALSVGSSNYAYLLGGDETSLDSVPAAMTTVPSDTGESAIWTYDTFTDVLSSRWVNPNGDIIVPAFFLYSNNDVEVLGITGDFSLFSDAYGHAIQVVISLVPDSG